ncbi:MAG: DNA mismatch repair endonuclease MutL [Planctomycetaceae bacterium]|nr:DNA mismatch repair endonuclease MutL [Planctomycetales bacterium]MCB9920760.1 DNA mismatch repair endonuclease MutL [Planctomycetaceae bacterium]
MPTITQLPTSVINKIAAGEVIERPASVIKELLENSVDAGATRIDVSIEKGGADLIRIADDGCGIVPEQMKLAVASHATSKIRDADDLFHVRTLGFRGEALASISEISHFLMRSRTPDSSSGSELSVTAGTIGEIVPCGCPVGTSIEVRNLFCSTPVRRKFLRTTQTEMGHISEAFTRIALAHPQIHFTLKHNDRTLFELPADENWRERITTFFGQEIGDAMIWVDNRDEESSVRLSGYVANPSHSRSNNRMQYLFLNQRFIRDRSLQHALGEAYRGLLMTGRFPIAFLQLDMPAEMVDVNVHPTKLEVRFQDGGRVYSQLLGTLRSKFLSSDLTAKESLTSERTSDKELAIDPVRAEQLRHEVTGWAKGVGGESQEDATRSVSSSPPKVSPAAQQRMPLSYDRAMGRLPEFRPFGEQRIETSPVPPGQDDEMPRPEPNAVNEFAEPNVRPMNAREERSSIGLQLHNRYIVTENESGMVVIDQHALHERVLYEQIREKVLAGKVESQRLLVPEPVALTAGEAGAALELKDTLAEIGIEIESFGGDTVVISAYPAMLANISPAEVLRQVVDVLLGGEKKPDRRDVLDELLHMISCKAAIKAGDRLSVEEVDALLEQRHLFHDTHHCPHGRPTALVFTREELDKRFKRI